MAVLGRLPENSSIAPDPPSAEWTQDLASQAGRFLAKVSGSPALPQETELTWPTQSLCLQRLTVPFPAGINSEATAPHPHPHPHPDFRVTGFPVPGFTPYLASSLIKLQLCLKVSLGSLLGGDFAAFPGFWKEGDLKLHSAFSSFGSITHLLSPFITEINSQSLLKGPLYFQL